ncbi:hypothetical protein BMS3Bbin04_01614 [bacterium BMS3Bbin04]|nr:hypothetical protein BMS3Bbin04_01614 [bacterium BMS3Bbin04]
MFTRISLTLALALVIGCLGLSGCTEDDDPAGPSEGVFVDDLIEIAQVIVDDLTATLYSTDSLHVGENPMYVLLEDADGNPFTAQGIDLHPMMYMADMNHACPCGDPVAVDGEDGLFQCKTMFIMPSGMTGTWDVGVTVTPSEGDDVELTFEEVTVFESVWMQKFSYDFGEGDVWYYVSIVGLENAEVGTNDVELWVATKESMMSFPNVADLTTEIETLMPSMGHGSTGNVAPVDMGNGRYEGVVGLSMTGDWEITFTFFNDESEELGTIIYAFVF